MTSDWGNLRLGDHCLKIGSGATPRGGKESYQAEGPYALIRSQNIYNDGFQTTGIAFISNEQAEKLNNVAVAIGDVLLNITGDSVARVCMAPKKFPNARVNQHVAIIRPNPDVFDSRFLKYFLTSPAQQELMLSHASVGGTRNALTKGMIEDFLVAHPSIHEQRNIANLLAGFDSCIAELQVENTTLESLAQTLFRSWFVDFDPVHAKAAGNAPEAMSAKLAALFPSEFKNSELGLIPKGWSVRTVEGLIKRLKPKQRYNIEETEPSGSVPIFDQSNGVLVGFGTVPGEVSATAKAPAFIFGDHTCVTKLSTRSFNVAPNVIPLTSTDRAGYWTFYAVRKLQTFEGYRRHWSDLIVRKVAVPDIALGNAFDEIAGPVHAYIDHNLLQVSKLTQLRDHLLPRLISGKLRIEEAEAAVAAIAPSPTKKQRK